MQNADGALRGGGYNNKRLNECYMHYKEFVKLYEHLYDNKIIEKSTILMLYNWGEPLLNKDYVQIIEFLAEKGQRFSISTNASKVELVHKKSAYKNCDSFTFSMSGFSQESYNRIHGFSFEKIKKNILELNKNIKENGFCGDGSISFHVYKFNKCEIQEAKKFADSLQLRFNPYYPYFNGNSMMQAYLENTMQKNKKDLAEEELYLSHVKDIISARPENYECCIKDIITINSEGILTLCCASDDACSNFKWGSAYNIKSFEQMKKKREEMLVSDTCAKCRQLGMDYWIDKNPSYEIK